MCRTYVAAILCSRDCFPPHIQWHTVSGEMMHLHMCVCMGTLQSAMLAPCSQESHVFNTAHVHPYPCQLAFCFTPLPFTR